MIIIIQLQISVIRRTTSATSVVFLLSAETNDDFHVFFQIFFHEMSLFLPGAQDDIYKQSKTERYLVYFTCNKKQ